MPALRRPARLLRALLARASRPAALLAWVGQVAIAAAPLVEACVGESTRPHIEAGTNPLHHAHDPELCPACTAQTLVGGPEAPRPMLADVSPARNEPPPARVARVARTASPPSPHARPRAPPVRGSELRSAPRHEFDSLTTTIDAIRTLAVRANAERRSHRSRTAA